MKKKLVKYTVCFTFFAFLFFYFSQTKSIRSSPSTEFKDQLTSAQLSYYAKLGIGNSAGNSIIFVNTTGTTLSTNNYNLDIGDTLSVGLGTTTIYTVQGLSDTNAISLNAAIGVGITTGLPVISRRYSVHNIYFKPQSSISGGKWQVLIKATNGAASSDNIPDTDGFDYGNLTAGAVTCPWGATASVGTTTVISTNSYHVITCSLGAGITNPINVGTSIFIGNATNMLMNPAPATGHTVGQANSAADTYTVFLRHLDSASVVLDDDTTAGKIALTESVRITVTVDPTLTFSVGNSGVTSIGTTICGSPLGIGAPETTGGEVNFGSLNLSAFNNLAQFIQCTTNAANGYVVQAFESHQFQLIGGATTIPDTTCPANSCTTTSAAAWTTNTTSGFGYSLQVGSTSVGSLGLTAALGIDVSGQYKPFGVGYANAQPIMSRTDTPSAIDSAYIGYRVTVSTSQPAGTYQNEINFIATATF